MPENANDNVQRYGWDRNAEAMVPEPGGDFVLFSDHRAEMIQALRALKAKGELSDGLIELLPDIARIATSGETRIGDEAIVKACLYFMVGMLTAERNLKRI